MKLGFVSDIHSNIDAFIAVLRFLETKNVDRIYIAGDLLGYYYHAADVVDLCMRREDIFCIRGNHDRNFLAALSDDGIMDRFTEKYGFSFKKAQDELTRTQVNWIRNLPSKLNVKISGIRIIVAHGSIENKNQYIYPDSHYELFMQQVLYSDITVLGHTHHSFIWCKNNKYLINPGSVGQPRDQSSLSSAVVLDTSNNAIVPYKIKFNTEKLKQEIAKFDPDKKYLVSVLERK